MLPTLTKKLFGILLVLIALSVLVVGNATSAHANASTLTIQSKHPITPLANCAVTIVHHVSNTQDRTCLVPANQITPNTAKQGCSIDYYQNGPYGSSAWYNGWGACVVGYGNYYVPIQLNDQASSWDSSCDGIFYANQPGTAPSAYFPKNSAGNFPWGSVPNDSLSSAYIYADC